MQRLIFSMLVLSSISIVFATTEPNTPADTTKDLLSQFEFDRRLDEEYAGESYPQRGDVVVVPDLYELETEKSDYQTTIDDLEKEQEPTFPDRIPHETESPEVPKFPASVSIGTEPTSKVAKSTVAPNVKPTDSLPKSSGIDPKVDKPTPAVTTESTPSPVADQDSYHLYKKIKPILRQNDIDSQLRNENLTSHETLVPTLAPFPGRNPNEEDSENNAVMAAVLPAVIVLVVVACLVITLAGLLLYRKFRFPAKNIGEEQRTGPVKLIGVHNRGKAYEEAHSQGLTPNQRFCSKGNYYLPNIIEQMPENLLNDKTVFVDSKSEKLVRSDGRGRSLSPIRTQSLERDNFYSQLLDNETALKTPAGLGEDADSKGLSSDSRLRFVTISLEEDDIAPTPTGGRSGGHLTHVCQI